MQTNYIAIAIPFFFLLIGLELLLQRAQGKQYYRLNDSITGLSTGVSQQVIGLFLKIGILFVYHHVSTRWSLWRLAPDAWQTWAVAFVGTELMYYWWHRLSHEVNFLWAVHVVHHHSEEYNLTVALRQPLFSDVTVHAFYLLLAFVGVPLEVFLAVTSLALLYQFWIHTRTIGRLGPLEWLLNTPSNHRVHHGINPEYIDRNHGATLMIWDHLFGTYQREEAEVVYGTVSRFRSWNPIWANFEHWAKVWRQSCRFPRLADRLKVWIQPPGWRPENLGGQEAVPPVDARTFQKFDRPYPRALQPYVILQYVPVIVGTFCLEWFEAVLSVGHQLAIAGLLLLPLVTLGGLLETRSWAPACEAARLGMTACAVVAGVGLAAPWTSAALAALAVLLSSAAWLWRIHERSRAAA